MCHAELLTIGMRSELVPLEFEPTTKKINIAAFCKVVFCCLASQMKSKASRTEK